MAFFAPALIIGSVSLGYGIYAWLSSGVKTQPKTPGAAVIASAVSNNDTNVENKVSHNAIINKVVAAPSVVTPVTEVVVLEPEVFFTAQAVAVPDQTVVATETQVKTATDVATSQDNVAASVAPPTHRDIYIPISVQQEFYQRYRNVVGEISQRCANAGAVSAKGANKGATTKAAPITAVRIRELREFRQLRDSRKKIARPILDGVQTFNKQSLKPATRRKLADKTSKPTLQDQIKSAVQQRFATSYEEI